MPFNKTSTVAPGADVQFEFHAYDIDGKEEKPDNIKPLWSVDKQFIAELETSEDGYSVTAKVAENATIGSTFHVEAILTLPDGTNLSSGLFPVLIQSPGFKPVKAEITQVQ